MCAAAIILSCAFFPSFTSGSCPFLFYGGGVFVCFRRGGDARHR